MFYRQECIYNEEKQRELVIYWQDILSLQQWDIKAKIVRDKDMSLEESQGTIDYRLCGLEALIKQMDPIDWSSVDFEYDMETSLVHEILHLIFAPMKLEGENAEREEQAINIIARALVGLKRQSRKEGSDA